MRRLSFLLLLLAAGAVSDLQAQSNPWTYLRKISFPVADSIAARPYLCTLNPSGRLYVISAKVDDPNAHNAIYYANPGDTLFTLLIDYDRNGDSDTLIGNIGSLRGIATVGNDLLVTASQPYPKTKPNTLAAAYYYRNADTNLVERFGWGIAGAGYGSFINSGAFSSDTMCVTGIDFGTSVRWYNWGTRYTRSARGSWNPPDTNNTSIFSNATEPGGPQTAGLDLIRDVALIPGQDYFSRTTAFYTSRNSLSGTQVTGGIAVWKGGTQIQPINYLPSRLSDFDGFLSFMNFFPYGITVDTRGILWVAGVDSARRWVKGFQVDGVNALAMYDLPSQNSYDIPDPAGAPMIAPSDVALTADVKTAYVIDRYARCAWVFVDRTTGVEDGPLEPESFVLHQNYPNPFNPSTMISFTLPEGGEVRLVVTDLLGREVRRLIDGYVEPGKHAASFDATGLPSGAYFYSLTTSSGTRTRAMLYLK